MKNLYQNSIHFTKRNLLLDLKGPIHTLNNKIKRDLKSKKLLQLKKGIYTTAKTYLDEPDKTKFAEFISSQICQPSYLSLEYILHKHHLLFKTSQIRCITTKTNRAFTNFLGTFKYSNIKKSCYFGFEEALFHDQKYYIATKAKALFDYIYLKPNINHRNAKKLKEQLFEKLEIQWTNFSEEDFKQFDKYVWKSNSRKMMRVLYILNDYFSGKNFDKWAKELLE